MNVVLYMAMSVNGYIAQEDDATPWSEEEWNSYVQMVKRAGNLVVGRRTYDIMLGNHDFERLGNPLVVVVSRRRGKDTEAVFAPSPRGAVALLRKRGFREALLGGGGKLNAGFLKEGLIDEIYLDVEPVVFGKGIKLFHDDGDFQRSLRLVDVQKISKGLVQLHYQVKK